MNKIQILQLIEASQATLKHELLAKYPESKYHLLMLQRSFQLVKNYIEVATQNEQQQLDIFQDYFQFPIQNLEQGAAQFCIEMAKQSDLHAIDILQQLNQLDLDMIKAG